MRIEKAKTADLAALVTLVNGAYRGEASKKGWTSEADLLAGGIRINEPRMLAALEDETTTILVYRTEDNLISGCVSLADKKTHLYLGMLTVNPEAQGSGIGKQLLQAAEAIALQKGLVRIRMTVITARKELLQWYYRHGYLDTGAREPFPYEPGFGEPTEPLEFAVLEKIIQ
jgi:GNAT superfamily N-acetyltransferase